MLVFHLDFNYVSLRYEFVKELLDKVALLGYDAILWELEEQVKWETCPECALPDSWSKEQFRELLEYSRELKLEPIPLLQTIGHGEYVMKHEAYFEFREHQDYSDCYCVSNPNVRSFLKTWINEYCELFGELKYFHLGGDEAYRFGSCPKCSKRDRNDLYGEHINGLASDLLTKNIRPGIWNDMILHHPENLDSISTNFIIWDWNYITGVGTPETVPVWGGGHVSKESVTLELQQKIPEILTSDGELNPFYTADFMKNRGYDVILCSAARSFCDSPFYPNFPVHAPNIIGASIKCRKSQLLGHCVTSWAIRLNPVLLGVPLLALPKFVDSFPESTSDELQQKTARHYLGFSDGLHALNNLCVCDNRPRVFSAIQWSSLKDSIPAPPNYIHTKITEWIADEEAYWINIESMFSSMIAAARKGLALLAPYAKEQETAALWERGGRLELRYIELLQAIFVSKTEVDKVKDVIIALKNDIVDYYSCEQTLTSAEKNADLILNPLLDYLEDLE